MNPDLKSFFESHDRSLKSITRKSKEISKSNRNDTSVIQENNMSEVQLYHPNDYTQFEEKTNDKLYPVYIILFSNNTASAKLIKTATGTPYSHAAISLDATMNNMYSFSALPYTKGVLGGDVTIGRESIWSPQNTTLEFFTVLVTFVDKDGYDAIQKKINNFIQNVDKFKYNTLGCIEYYFGAKNLKKHDENTKNRWFCSEFVAVCIASAGVPGFDNIYLSPNDLSTRPNVISLGKYTVDAFDEKDVLAKTKKAEVEFRKNRTLDIELESSLDSDSYYGLYSEATVMRIPKEPNPVKTGWYDDDNVWNSLVMRNRKRYRERSETLIIKYINGVPNILLRKRNDGIYQVPGGSTEPGKTLRQQAIDECKEEVHIIPKNIIYYGSYYKDYGFLKDYDGCVSHIFVAQYDKMYTGRVADVDQDMKMLMESQWYPIDQLRDYLMPCHLNALVDYLKRVPAPESMYESVVMDKIHYYSDNRCTAFVDWKKLYDTFREEFPRTNPSLRFPMFQLIVDKLIRPTKVAADKVTSVMVSEIKKIRKTVKHGFIMLIDTGKALIFFNNDGQDIILHYPDDKVLKTESVSENPPHTEEPVNSVPEQTVSSKHSFLSNEDSDIDDLNAIFEEVLSGMSNDYQINERTTTFSDVKKIVDKIPKSEHHYFYNGKTFKDSPYVFYRDAEYVNTPNGKAGAFIDVYHFDDSPETGIVVIAAEPGARGKGLTDRLISKAIPKLKEMGVTNLIWRADSDNEHSIALAKRHGFVDIGESDPKQLKLKLTLTESAGVMNFLPSVPIEQKVLSKSSSIEDDLFGEDCNLEETTASDDGTLMKETLEYNISKGFNKEVILYHGSPYKLSKITPQHVNYGTRLSKPRVSSFWTDDRDAAAIRGFTAWVPNNIPEDVRRTMFMSEDVKNKKMYITKPDLDKLKQWAANCVVYVHEAKVPTKYVGRGHDSVLREYSVDIPVYTRRIYEYKFDDILKFIIVTDFDTVRKIAKRTVKDVSFTDALLYGDYMDEVRKGSFDLWKKHKLMKLPKEPPATKNGWFDNNCWNSLVVKGNKRYRERVETIIFGYAGDAPMILARKKPDGTYALPGGSSEPGKSLMAQAIRECQEEVHVTPKKLIYYGYYIKNWDKSKSYTKDYDGYIVHYFVGLYDSMYSGEVRPEDRDNKMLTESKWYSILNISNILSEEHLTALEDYTVRINMMHESASSDDLITDDGYDIDEPTEEDAIEEFKSSYESVFEFKNELADETLEVKTTKFAPRTLFIESANYHYPDIVHELVEDVLSDIESGNPDYADKQSLVWRMTGENVVPLSAIAEDLGFVQIESILPADDKVTYAMDISKFTPEKSSYLSEAARDLSHIFRADDEHIYLNVPYCEFYIPTEYFAMGKKFAEDFTDKINVIGLFNIGLFEDDKLVDVKVFNVPVYLDINVYDYDVRMIDVGSGTPVECRVYKYFKDAIICRSFIPENSSVAQTFLQLIISGSMPGTIPYSQCLSVWRKNLELSGVSLGVSSAVMEMILAVMYRDARDPSKKYCIRYGSSADSSEFDYMSASIRQICQYNSTFTGIIYEDIDSMITSAINRNRNGKEEGETPMEKIIKM